MYYKWSVELERSWSYDANGDFSDEDEIAIVAKTGELAIDEALKTALKTTFTDSDSGTRVVHRVVLAQVTGLSRGDAIDGIVK